MDLDDSIKVLEKLKKFHHKNSALHSQTSLKSYMGNVKNLLQIPKDKNLRIINPLIY